MTLSLAKDKLNYTPEQMEALSQQLRLGDLTAVMQIYEDDIRSPLRSAVGGSLLRTLLVQVQKAKVCQRFVPRVMPINYIIFAGGYRPGFVWHRQIAQVSRIDLCVCWCRSRSSNCMGYIRVSSYSLDGK